MARTPVSEDSHGCPAVRGLQHRTGPVQGNHNQGSPRGRWLQCRHRAPVRCAATQPTHRLAGTSRRALPGAGTLPARREDEHGTAVYGDEFEGMKKGFYTIMAAQFFSSLADNALLIAAIALLTEMHAPQWMTPLLKLFFVLSYVLLAAFVGAFADSRPKGKVMLITNAIKLVGCGVMLTGLHPLLAYGVVGFGAAAYSPAKLSLIHI